MGSFTAQDAFKNRNKIDSKQQKPRRRRRRQ
jgi:hypothetical protein